MVVELDRLIDPRKQCNISTETVIDIIVKTITYIKSCDEMKSKRKIQMIYKFIKYDLLGVPLNYCEGMCMVIETHMIVRW